MTTECHASWTSFINKVKVVVVSRLTSMEPILILSKMLYKLHALRMESNKICAQMTFMSIMYTLATVHIDLFIKSHQK